ncbi:MAG: YIP1 family protein [Alphaproteobacteria bacterium]|nr:YIP1 family protein [Alphaproteobacteria bacterium]
MNYFERKEPGFDHEADDYRDPIAASSPQKKYKRRKFKSHPFLNYWLNLLFFAVIGFSLLGINFTLYVSSAAGNIFESFPVLKSEVFSSLAVIGVITFVVYFCLSGFTVMLSLLSAGIVYLFCAAMFAQFANFNTLTLAAAGHSSTYACLAGGVIAFCLLFFSNKKIRFFFAVSALFAFGAVLYHQNYEKPEFKIDSPNLKTIPSDAQKGKKFIDIMLPNFPSYGYIAGLEDSEANKIYREELREIMLGFYAKYGFKLFPNAYVSTGNPYLNAANALNYKVPENQYDNLQTQVMKESYWQFKNRNDFEAYIKNSQMFDELKSKGYAINSYQSHGINLCRQNNQNIASRCTTRIINPIMIQSSSYSTFEKAEILLVQWLESTEWLNGLSKIIYERLKTFYNPETTPVFGMSYKNLYVVDSLKTLDKVLEDIMRDSGDNAYFIYLDMPSELFVYDDVCRLKDMDSWLPKNNRPWVGRNNVLEKRSSYFNQTMCLYGKLSQFMQSLQKADELNDTTIIIQGLNGMDDLLGDKNAGLADNFLNRQTAGLAIFSSDNHKFTVNKSVCSVPDILNQYFNNIKCVDFNETGLSKTTKQAVMKKLDSVIYNNDVASKSFRRYNEWLRKWNQINYRTLGEPSLISKLSEDKNAASAEENPAPEGKKEPSLLPLEEKKLEKQTIMQGQVNVAPEAKVKSLNDTGAADVAQQ